MFDEESEVEEHLMDFSDRGFEREDVLVLSSGVEKCVSNRVRRIALRKKEERHIIKERKERKERLKDEEKKGKKCVTKR